MSAVSPAKAVLKSLNDDHDYHRPREAVSNKSES